MTVYYASEVATCRGLGCFPKLLFRWRASIYKLIWKDVLLYLSGYYTLNFSYEYLMNDYQKEIFELIVMYCNSSLALIPVMFVLGFYVSLVVKRWWAQYMTLPWPDNIAVYVSATVTGLDERGRLMRRTIMRYVCLAHTVVMTMISPRVKKRFPKMEHIKEAGLLNEGELEIFKSMIEKFGYQYSYWVPIVWATSIVSRARKEGRIRDDAAVKSVIDALNSFRGMLMVLLFYDTISIPLVYTQVVTIAVYSFLLYSLLGRQWINKDSSFNLMEYFAPIFSMLEFLFFMGWLKVAESLISPFGNDDDDFELNWLIDRNLQVSYLIVDEMHNEHPELVRDQYWDKLGYTVKLPYATDTDDGKTHVRFEEPPLHSTAKLYSNVSDITLTESQSNLHNRTSFSPFIPESMKSVNFLHRIMHTRDTIPLLSKTSSSYNNTTEISESITVTEENIEELMDEEQSLNWQSESSYSIDVFEMLKMTRNRERRKRNQLKIPFQAKIPLEDNDYNNNNNNNNNNNTTTTNQDNTYNHNEATERNEHIDYSDHNDHSDNENHRSRQSTVREHSIQLKGKSGDKRSDADDRKDKEEDKN